MVHRDVSPANVLITRGGIAKVTDFGIAKGEEQARAGHGQTKGVIGSLWYMSPEQVQGQRDLDKRVADAWLQQHTYDTIRAYLEKTVGKK